MIIHRLNTGQEPFGPGETKETVERRTFVMPCPANGCRGFLSQAYKCGICDIYACPECREVKGLDRDAEHTCKPENVESVKLMKKDTRPCPKCGTGIFKIEGCDQMFCTNCNTPFSWNTGNVVTTGAIHNPHYYEYLRNMNGGIMPRAPGDIPCGAHLPNAWNFQNEITRKFPSLATNAYFTWLLSALRVVTHIQHVEVPRYTNHAEDTDNTDTNVRYLEKGIDEKRWKQILQQREKRRMKRDDMRMRLEAFVGACIDIYGRLVNRARNVAGTTPPGTATVVTIKEMTDLLKEAYVQLQSLRTIFNEGMLGLSKLYKCQIIQLGEHGFKIEMKRHESGRSKKAADESDDDDSPNPATNVLVPTGAR